MLLQQPQEQQQQQQQQHPPYPFSATQGWMTLRVPPHLPANGQLWANGQFFQDASGGHIILRPQHQPPPQQQQQLPFSRTLGRNYGSNNNGSHIVMPNPDDILPKEAWTDFSGTDEWPRFSGLERRSASDMDDNLRHSEKGGEGLERQPLNSAAANYVNRVQPDHCQKEDNGNHVCPQQPPLNGGLHQSESSGESGSSTSNNNNNSCYERGLPTSASQQIENNLMGIGLEKEDSSSSLTKNQNDDIWTQQHQQQPHSQRPSSAVARNQRPPQPPKRLQQQNLRKKDQRNTTTKQQPQPPRLLLQNNKEVNGTTTFLLNHTNDTSNGGCHSEAEEESDNEVMERSPLFQPLDDQSTQWHNSPLQ